MSTQLKEALSRTLVRKQPERPASRAKAPGSPTPMKGPHPFDAHRTSTWRSDKWCNAKMAELAKGPILPSTKPHLTVNAGNVNGDPDLPLATPEFGRGNAQYPANLRVKSTLICDGTIIIGGKPCEVFRAFAHRRTGCRSILVIINQTRAFTPSMIDELSKHLNSKPVRDLGWKQIRSEVRTSANGRAKLVARFILAKGQSTAFQWGKLGLILKTALTTVDPNLKIQDYRNTQVPVMFQQAVTPAESVSTTASSAAGIAGS